MSTESYGPDRCRNSLNCTEFHDTPIERLDDHQHCCCCNACLTIRPGEKGDGVSHHHCCRCIPRMIFLQFTSTGHYGTSTGTGVICCRDSSVPMLYQGTDEDYISSYTATLHGVTVLAELGSDEPGTGSVVGTSTSTADACMWRITVTGKVSDNNIYYIDHTTYSCMDVSAIEIGSIEGPDGCEGTLTLINQEAGFLPYILREDIDNAIGTANITGTGTDQEHMTLDPVCGGVYGTGTGTATGTGETPGECTQVCSKICVSGHRTLDGATEYVEFQWFDNGWADRGWSYESSTETEYIYLKEDASGNCILNFSWTGSAIIPDQVIDLDRGCSCGMKEVVTANVGLETIGFTIRCGNCTCWNFFCGTCRCVPATLCVQTYIDNVFTTDIVLAWDSDARSWVSDEGVGTGSGREIEITLTENDDGECVIQPFIDGQAVGDPTVHDCGSEHTDGEFDASNDFFSGTWEGFIETGTGSPADEYAWILASSQMDDCRPGQCNTATPCIDSCGSHPDELTLTISGWNAEPGGGTCDLEMTLQFWEAFSFPGSFETTCGYIGYAFVGYCNDFTYGMQPKWVKATLNNGNLSISYTMGPVHSWVTCPGMNLVAISEGCDPYYGSSGTQAIGLNDCCFSCDTAITHYTAVITE